MPFTGRSTPGALPLTVRGCSATGTTAAPARSSSRSRAPPNGTRSAAPDRRTLSPPSALHWPGGPGRDWPRRCVCREPVYGAAPDQQPARATRQADRRTWRRRFAWRRGRPTGGGLVDLGDGNRVADVLDGRNPDDFAARLAAHPGIQLICRDRASGRSCQSRPVPARAVQPTARPSRLQRGR